MTRKILDMLRYQPWGLRPFDPIWILILCAMPIAQAAGQRITFSVDTHGPTAGASGTDNSIVDAFYGLPITGADILTVGVPQQELPPTPNLAVRGPVEQPPGVVIFANNPAPNARSLGLQLIDLNGQLEAELDALSFGRDTGTSLLFSVDEFSVGTRGELQQQAAEEQASADVFRSLDGTLGNALTFDGRGGERPNRALGLGLIEPNPPTPDVPDIGDNLDALDVNTTEEDLTGPIYFSLDANFNDVFEPQGPAHLGSAFANDRSGADILVVDPARTEFPQVYLDAGRLGLDFVADDVDALALFDAEGDLEFDPEVDQVLFSVRRGSAILNQPDGLLGLPIRPGDILGIPDDPETQNPFIVITAEELGLFADRGTAVQRSIDGVQRTDGFIFDDDLVAVDLVDQNGDMNCNTFLDPDDATQFVLALDRAEDYFFVCGESPVKHGDLSMNGQFGFEDIEVFVQLMESTGVLSPDQAAALFSVPEPSSLHLWSYATFLLWIRKSHR